MRALLIVAATGCWTSTSTPPPTNVAKQDPAKPVAVVAALKHQSAEALLTVDHVRKITGYADQLDVVHNDPTTPSYEDVHFKAIGKTERFDVMLRVWTLDKTSANKKLDQMIAELPGVRPLPGLADRAITAVEGEIYGVAFFDQRGAAVLVTCGMGQCGSIDQTITIARGVAERIR